MEIKCCNIPIFVPHQGCPNDCIFCNQKQITGAAQQVTAATVEEIIETALATIPPGRRVQAAFFGGSFTGIPIDQQESLLEAVQKYLRSGKIQGIRLSTRPDYIDRCVLSRLKRFGVTAIELGVQSTSDLVLSQNHRGHTKAQVIAACRLIRSDTTFELGLQMMCGMYASTPDLDFSTAQDIAALSPDTVRIYPTVVLGGTGLEKLYRTGQYQPPSLEDTVELCSRLWELFTGRGIHILRLGLQSTDTICEHGAIIAGPYHSAFGELVRSRVLRRKMETFLSSASNGFLRLRVHPKTLSAAIGNRRENIRYFLDSYSVQLSIAPDPSLPQDAIAIL